MARVNRSAGYRTSPPTRDSGIRDTVELPAPEIFIGRTLKQLELRPKYGLTLIAIKRRPSAGGQEVTNIAPSADEVIRAGDVLSILGSNDRLGALDARLKG